MGLEREMRATIEEEEEEERSLMSSSLTLPSKFEMYNFVSLDTSAFILSASRSGRSLLIL